ncbi:hypothetical protein E6A57_06295 [Lactobacillus crispatus]|uniref:hypothetical protein n=1 Tax=Lactobacillus crispatus TaxID=47770 RepID=UPI001303DC36|nr:hypothetical protein [Lactobacillus crispatus]QGY95074.1 hypothetical protein E6A57_06295 [Lactobacillus crispatus]
MTVSIDLRFAYTLSYLPTKRSRIPRFTDEQGVTQLNLSNVNATEEYEVREFGESYTIYSYKNKLYRPFNSRDNTLSSAAINDLRDHDRKTASISRPYRELDDDKKFAFNPLKSKVIYGRKQAEVEAEEWAKKSVIAVDDKAYIELKSPAIDASVVTHELAAGRLIIQGSYDDPHVFRLDQLDAFYEYVTHYRENLEYMLNHDLGRSPAAIKYKLEDFKRAMKNNYIKKA